MILIFLAFFALFIVMAALAVWTIAASRPRHGVGHNGVNCRNHLPLQPIFKKGGSHMQIIIAVMAIFGAAGTIIFLSSLNTNGGVKAALVALVVFIAVYSMARIQPKEKTLGKNTKK
ncbi:hypothetical protein D4R89_13435 [bacterium]|nr:MAG: hypothetical protein D4R89_13435 [bacterium]